MSNPRRADFLGRFFGAVVSLSFFVSGWLTGCASAPAPPDGPPGGAEHAPRGDVTEIDAEALLAGAEALCQQASILAYRQDVADTNELNQAICDSLRWACQLVPDNTNILEAAMYRLANRSLFDEAYALAQPYLERHPDNHKLRCKAACYADAAGKPKVAAEQCAIIHAALPDDRELEDALIRLYFLSDQAPLAFEMMRAAYARHPDAISKALPVNWAIVFASKQKDFELALQCVAIALDVWELPAERSPILTLAGECHVELGQTQEAIEAFSKAFGEDSANVLAIQHLGALCAQQPEATNLVNAALGDLKHADIAKLLLRASLQQSSDKAAAFTTLREAYARSMGDGYFPGEAFYLWLVTLLDDEKRSEEALPILKEAAVVHPSSPGIKNTLAYLWAERNENLKEANRLINEALDVHPENAAYLDTKGWILFRLNRPFAAIQLLLKAAERYPNDPVILDHVGDVLLAIGRKEDAIAFWKKSNQIAPNPLVEKKLAE